MLQLTLSLDRLQQLDDLALSRLVSAATLTDLMQFWAPSLPHLMHAGERFVRALVIAQSTCRLVCICNHRLVGSGKSMDDLSLWTH